MRRAGCLALLALLPGCLAPAAAPDPETLPARAILPWSLTDCVYVVAYVPVARERLEPFLPEGFALAVSDGPLAPAQGEAYLGVEAFRCASGAGLDGEIASMEYGSFFTSVEPPEELAVPEVDMQYLKWDVLVPDAPRRDVLLAAGLPARAGSAGIERLPGPARSVVATLTLEGLGGFRIEGVPEPERDVDEGGTFVEYMPREAGGVALWRSGFTIHTIALGRGVVTLEPGSWAAQVAGERAIARFITGTWTFAEGTITPRLSGPP